MITLPTIISYENSRGNEMSCCVDDLGSDEIPKDDCCENGCNPFVNCCGIMGFMISDPLTLKEGKIKHFNELFDLYSGETARYIPIYWQPPKV